MTSSGFSIRKQRKLCVTVSIQSERRTSTRKKIFESDSSDSTGVE
ncbi:hypothetical protein HSB1_47000 [Halogranum salarium B-1]|uniref:Uncharacterized protein n=1 Tax=Halogranum salarium B-1 TaxID=1210908 RepID=J2ZV18_9EURY|nr:hypothetical protein HSB1_47000 [Halogranum salarium B-1]